MEYTKLMTALIIILPLLVLSLTPQSSPPDSLILWSAMSYNWDGVAGADGLEISIRPQDAEGGITKVQGVLDAVLFTQSGEVIDSWTVVVPTENYTDMYSRPIRLSYSSEHPPCEFGSLHINFTCSGRTFSDTREGVPLGAT